MEMIGGRSESGRGFTVFHRGKKRRNDREIMSKWRRQ
jgi:hypothetical protein